MKQFFLNLYSNEGAFRAALLGIGGTLITLDNPTWQTVGIVLMAIAGGITAGKTPEQPKP